MVNPGYYFHHSHEICIVGIKKKKDLRAKLGKAGAPLLYTRRPSANVIIEEARESSRKPDEIYSIIDILIPGARKIELFARNHNLRKGWFSLGNQLGEDFIKGRRYKDLSCQIGSCQRKIGLTEKRYKSFDSRKLNACHSCATQAKIQRSQTSFIELASIDESEELLHPNIECDGCGKGLHGVRF